MNADGNYPVYLHASELSGGFLHLTDEQGHRRIDISIGAEDQEPGVWVYDKSGEDWTVYQHRLVQTAELAGTASVRMADAHLRNVQEP